jgi:hypothetical protein
MKLSEMKDLMVDELNKRMQESYDSRQSSGKYKDFFKEDIQLPIWKVKEGEHLIDLLPYPVNQESPLAKRGEIIGQGREVYVHDGVGVNENQYICVARMFNQRCPICLHQRQLRDQGEDPELLKQFNPKRRVVYNVLVYDTKEEEDRGVQIAVIAHYFFERHITELARSPRQGGRSGVVNIFHPKFGKSVSFRREGAGAKNTSYLGHRLIDREYEIPDSILDSTYCLEDIIHIPSYDEVYEAFHGKGVTEEVSTPPERPSLRTPRKPEQDAPPENPTPPPTPQRVPEKSSDQCPDPNGKFGVDIDKVAACNACIAYEACFSANTAIEAAEREKRRQAILRRSQGGSAKENS